jgi:hypothetical protein
MADLFKPKVKQAQATPLETRAAESADRERLEAVRAQAEQRTQQLMRLFGRSPMGFGTGRAGF